MSEKQENTKKETAKQAEDINKTRVLSRGTIEEKRAKEEKEGQNKKQPKAPQAAKPMWKRLLTDIRFYFLLVLYIIMAGFIFQAWNISMFPIKYLIPATVLLILIGIAMWWLQYSKRIGKINRILGKALIVILVIILGVGNVYFYQTSHMISKVTVEVGDTEYEYISIVVKKENEAEELKDVKDGIFAIPDKIDIEHTEETVKKINDELKMTIKTSKYANTNDQAEALLDDKVDAMMLNEAYRSLLDEKYPAFENDTKVIYTHKIPKKVKEIGVKVVDVNSTPYNVYISGIDTYGPIGAKSRSDVNMIATINPTTNQILLTSIPRDYYVAQTCQGNQQDKLTHSGIFGVDCTIESMENFTGLKFNYYVRVNFSSLESIVDAIGGIDIYNQMSFYSGVDGTFIPGGDIHVNGNTALKFARERHAYADGDRQRGRNQMIVLEAIIDKAISPSIITNYSGIMSAVGNSFQTNMTTDEMSSIVKKQLDNGASWSILQQGVTGEGGTDWTPANGFNAYVMYPDQTSVSTALANIQMVMDGETPIIE